MDFVFITGASRGIGKALAEHLLEKDQTQVTGISRSCSIIHPRYHHIAADLSNPAAASDFHFPPLEQAKKIVLVNNAGAITGIRHAGQMQNSDIVNDFHVNLVTPCLLINNFLSAYSKNTEAEKIIINISSGAASKPVDGWSIYCASKAGLEMFSRTIETEFASGRQKNFRIFSVAPGIVDTSMQDGIRQAHQNQFSRLDEFIAYKREGRLKTPASIAKKLGEVIASPDRFKETLLSFREN